MTLTPETPERLLARKVASRVVKMNPKAAEFESLIFLVVEYFAPEAITQAQDEKLEEAALRCESRAWANHDGVMPDGRMMNCAFAIRSLKSKD